jgi:hypothetical protein
MGEKRQYPRVAANRILVRIPTIERFRIAFLRDLSEGGMHVSTSETLPIDSIVEVELVPPGWNEPLLLEGRVSRVELDPDSYEPRATGMAIRFEELSEGIAVRLADLIAELLPETEAIDEEDDFLGLDDPHAPGPTPHSRPSRRSRKPSERIRELEEKLTAAAGAISELRERLEASEGALQDSVLRTEASERELPALRAALERAEEGRQAAEAGLASKREELAAAERLVDRLAGDKVRLDRRAKQALDELAKSRAEIVTLSDRLVSPSTGPGDRVRFLEESLARERESASLMMKALAEAEEAHRQVAGEADRLRAALAATDPSTAAPSKPPTGWIVRTLPTGPSPRPTPAPLPPTLPRIESAEEFERRVRGGAKLLRTERFRKFEPVNPAETRLAAWLERASDYGELSRSSAARMPDDQMMKLLFVFYRRQVIDLAL